MYTIHNTETKDEFETGARRDSQRDKPRIDLIDAEFLQTLIQMNDELPPFEGYMSGTDMFKTVLEWRKTLDSDYLTMAAAPLIYSEDEIISFEALERIGDHLRKGGEKYGDNNWLKGIPMSRVYASLLRHLLAYICDIEDGEDHMSAVFFNLMALYVYDRDDYPDFIKDLEEEEEDNEYWEPYVPARPSSLRDLLNPFTDGTSGSPEVDVFYDELENTKFRGSPFNDEERLIW